MCCGGGGGNTEQRGFRRRDVSRQLLLFFFYDLSVGPCTLSFCERQHTCVWNMARSHFNGTLHLPEVFSVTVRVHRDMCRAVVKVDSSPGSLNRSTCASH